MPVEQIVVGVDGGNTKTLAIAGTTDGRIVGWGRSGGSDLYQAKPGPAMEAVGRAVKAASAGLSGNAAAAGDRVKKSAIALSMAGADWPEDFEFIESEVRRRRLGDRVTVVNDGMGALRASSADGIGVAIACGTGATVGARSAKGNTWHSSFWQEVQGSRHLADKALSAIYKAELGLTESTTITEPVLTLLALSSVEELLHIASGREPHHRAARAAWDWSGITRILLTEAHSGDRIAHTIVTAHGQGLADYAIAGSRIVGLDEEGPFTLFLAGGVFRHESTVLREAIAARMRSVWPDARIEDSRFEPVIGAFLLAFESLGLVIADRLLQCVQQSLPPSDFFAT